MGRLARLFGREKRNGGLIAGQFVPPRAPYFTVAGPYVDTMSTLGLSTAAAAIKLISETIGMMPLKVYRGEKPDVSEARDSWQWYRLKEAPNEDQSAYDFWQDAAASIETAGNAFIWKAISRRPVQSEDDIQLILVDPNQINLRRDENNQKYYEIRRNGRMERISASQILLIRGWASIPGSDVGLSPIQLHRETIGSALGAREYQARFFSNGATIPGWISVPGEPEQEDVDRLQIEWEQRHAGLWNAHRPGVLANGATWIPSGLSMRDAQYIETQRFSSEEVCRIFRVTPGMLGIVPQNGVSQSVDEDFNRFLQADLGPRITRIEMSLLHDPDLFGTDSNLFPEFLTASVLKMSLTARYSAYKDAIQGTWMLPDEVRELENMKPLPDGAGQIPQITPVGGAPNPESNVPSNP